LVRRAAFSQKYQADGEIDGANCLGQRRELERVPKRKPEEQGVAQAAVDPETERQSGARFDLACTERVAAALKEDAEAADEVRHEVDVAEQVPRFERERARRPTCAVGRATSEAEAAREPDLHRLRDARAPAEVKERPDQDLPRAARDPLGRDEARGAELEPALPRAHGHGLRDRRHEHQQRDRGPHLPILTSARPI
jgi:hypothetical protein